MKDDVNPKVRKTYPQNWSAYNAAQTNEKVQFQILLHELCKGIKEPPAKHGRRPLSFADCIFSIAFKVYSTVSGRRFMCDLREAQRCGYIRKAPNYNSIFRYFENPTFSPILHELIHQCSLPLRGVEVDFVADSSGFATKRFYRWFDHRNDLVRKSHSWVKAHIMSGVTTNIVTAIVIRDQHASDAEQLADLVNKTASSFSIEEVSADLAYSSQINLELIAAHGAIPYIPFKSNTTGSGGGIWQQFYHYFKLNEKEFNDHYHKRSNVETTFHMIKAKFGDHVRSKTPIAQTNEVLAKVLCHNICCGIQAFYEQDIEPDFRRRINPQAQPA
jgi:transposase